MREIKALPRTVIALGMVSFFTDLSSEMIYPLLPVFLASVLGAGAVSLGLIEGLAEATAALLKVASGTWSDRVKSRKPMILGGYGLSGLVRPLVGLAGAWPFVLLIRFADRVGKGIRSSPRDALIADATPLEHRGMAYGLHRSMDHAGAVVGPLVAAGLLAFGLGLRSVFLLAMVPSVLVVLVILVGVKEVRKASVSAAPLVPWKGFRRLGRDYRRLLLALLVFTLGNSTDAFLLLRMSQAGVAASSVALLWAAHHGVKMAATFAGGRMADRIPPKALVAAGWLFYAAVYLGFAFIDSASGLVALFLAYGTYFGLTEPAEKAWVAGLAPAKLRGTAFGFYHGVIGIAALPASLLFGAVWQWAGGVAAFCMGASLAALAAVLLLRVRPA
jgi:MFS family permease